MVDHQWFPVLVYDFGYRIGLDRINMLYYLFKYTSVRAVQRVLLGGQCFGLERGRWYIFFLCKVFVSFNTTENRVQ